MHLQSAKPAEPRTRLELAIPLAVALACLLLIILEVPLTLHRPLTADCTLFDLEWRNLTRGGVLYRDIFQTNPPGTLWIHGVVRTWLGETSEALRFVDLLFVGWIIANLALWTKRLGRPPLVAWSLSLALIWFYGMQSIWCQCQRDLWMLAPCLGALNCRWKRTGDAAPTSQRVFRRSLAEGACWGFAMWIKPFAFVPAAAVWLVVQSGRPQPSRRIPEFCGLVAGGAVVGVSGGMWMYWTECLPWFVDTVWNWNGSYLSSRAPIWKQIASLIVHFGPWMLVYPLAAVISVRWLWRHVSVSVFWKESVSPVMPSTPGVVRRTESTDRLRFAEGQRLLAGFYLGWLVQSFGLQHGHGYVHVPGLMLASTMIAGEAAFPRARLWWPTVFTFGMAILWLFPLARFAHGARWSQCVTGPVDTDLRMALRGPLDRVYPGAVDEVELHDVVEYLRSRNVQDGEVCAYEYSAMRLYLDLNLAPPCRFVCPRIYALRFFPHRSHEIRQLLAQSPQRFVVTDLVIDRMSEVDANAVGPKGPHAPPPAWPTNVPAGLYPWSHPVVFRAGRYQVHEIQGPMGEFTMRPPWQSTKAN